MGLFLRFFVRPHPLRRSADVADNGLPALGDMDVLDSHLLLALRPVVLERLDLHGERACQFVGLVERAAKAMYESEHGRFDSFVELTVLDKAKQLALYHDDWWVGAGLDQNFERKDVEWLFAKCRSALLAIAEPKAMQAGKAMWQTQTVRRKRHPHG